MTIQDDELKACPKCGQESNITCAHPFHLYQARAEQNSVSLEECVKACMEADFEAFKNTNYARLYDKRTLGERYAEVTKAVLTAAGVKFYE